jgi:hypothetical protein
MRLVVQITGDAEGGPWHVVIIHHDDTGDEIDSAFGILPARHPLPSLDDETVPRDALATGEELLEWIAPVDAGDKRREIWDSAVAHGTCDLVLDVRPNALRGVAWELIGNEQCRPFCHTSRGAGAMAKWPFERTASPLASLPVNLLVVIGAVDASVEHAELEALYRALDDRALDWYVDVLRQPTRDEFIQEYRRIRPHILHVLGHGGEGREGAPHAIRIREADEQTWMFDREFVFNRLRDTGRGTISLLPRVVVLNGCHTASTGDPGPVEALVESGCTAVISNSGKVDAEVAATFTEELYRSLAGRDRDRRDRDPIDRAVKEARRKIHDKDKVEATAWARPRLTVAADPATILARPTEHNAVNLANNEDVGFYNMDWFVDRTTLRRAVNDELARGTRLIVISGSPIDVTPVAKSCVVTARANGLNVVYVDLAAIGGPVHRTKFCEEVENCTNDWQTLSSERRVQPAPPLALPGNPRSGSRDAGSYEQLRTFLAASAGDSDLILWLDQVHRIDDFEEFYRHFLAPRRPRAEPRIRFVLVDSPVWVADKLTSVGHTGIPITPVALSDGPSFAREFLSRRHRLPTTGKDYKEDLRQIGEEMVQWVEGLAFRAGADPHLDVEKLFAWFRKRIVAAGLPRELVRPWR